MSSTFPLAIENGTSSFLSLVQEKLNMPADTIIGFVPEVAVKNHLIKIHCNPERGNHYLLPTALNGHAITSELVNFSV